jgi:hypothetical protein
VPFAAARGLKLTPRQTPVEKLPLENLSSAFSTEIAATTRKQSENFFAKNRIYIDEPEILVSAVEKACRIPAGLLFSESKSAAKQIER